MAGLYVIEFFIHAFHSPDLDVFNGLKCDLAPLSTKICYHSTFQCSFPRHFSFDFALDISKQQLCFVGILPQ
jgi:hypothetical protein